MTTPTLTRTETRTVSPFDSIKKIDNKGTEYWSARDLMPLMGYSTWQKFTVPVERAMKAAENQGQAEAFTRSVNRVSAGGGFTVKQDVHLSRFAAYLVAMNGDPNKAEVAAAQAYFAVNTYENEQRKQYSIPATYAEALELAAAQTRELEAKNEQIARDAPKVLYHDEVIGDDDLIPFRVMANQIGLRERDLRQILIDAEWIYRVKREYKDTDGYTHEVNQYRPYAHKAEYFRLIPFHYQVFTNGETAQTLKVTALGEGAILKLIRENVG